MLTITLRRACVAGTISVHRCLAANPITAQQVLFILFGAFTLGAALMVVTRRNVFHAALFLILSFFGVAGLVMLLEAPLLAGVQLFIFASSIAILIVLAIMRTREMMNPVVPGTNRQWEISLLVAVALCSVLARLALNYDWGAPPGPAPADSMANLGKALVDSQGFVLPVEVTALLLLVTFISAVMIARER